MFRYVRKLNETPSRMIDEDAAALFAAGWDDRVLHDAVAICALFNCMKRLVEGFGISTSREYFQVSAERLAPEGGYDPLLKVLRGQTTQPSE